MFGQSVPFMLKQDGCFHLSGVVLREQNPITVSVSDAGETNCPGFGLVK